MYIRKTVVAYLVSLAFFLPVTSQAISFEDVPSYQDNPVAVDFLGVFCTGYGGPDMQDPPLGWRAYTKPVEGPKCGSTGAVWRVSYGVAQFISILEIVVVLALLAMLVFIVRKKITANRNMSSHAPGKDA